MSGELGHDGLRFAMMKNAAQESMENLHDFLAKPLPTRLELTMAVMAYFADQDAAESYSEEIVREGPLDHHASTELTRLVKSAVMAQFVAKSGSMDGLSKLLQGTYSERKRGEPYRYYNEELWIAGLEGKMTDTGPMFGQFGQITGKSTGLGKTGWAVRLGEILLAKDPSYYVVTNIRADLPPELAPRWRFVLKLSDALRAMLEIKRAGGRTLLILDESLFIAGRRDASKKSTVDFEKMMRLFRKWHASLVLIMHDEKLDLPDAIRRFITTTFEKRNLKEMVATVGAEHIKFNKYVTGVPNAGVPYDNEARGGLLVDIDIQHLHDWLNSQDPGSSEHEDVLTLQYLADPRLWRDHEEGEGAAPSAPDDFSMAEEIKANRTRYFLTNGRLNVAEVRRQFNLDEKAAYRVGRLAKT